MTDHSIEDQTPEQGHERWGLTEFVPGQHVGLVGHLTIALIEAGHASTRDRLWDLVASDAPIDDLLDELSATGLKSLPSFAVGQLDGGDLRLVARGATRVTVTFGDESQKEVDPSDVRTWREDVFTGVARLGITLDPDGNLAHLDPTDRFFVLAGSVPAASIERRFDGADALSAVASNSWHPAAASPVQNEDLEQLAGESVPVPEEGVGELEPVLDSSASAVDDPAPEPELAGFTPLIGSPDAEAELRDSGGATEGSLPTWADEAMDDVVEALPTLDDEVSSPPEDSNETISSINFGSPEPEPKPEPEPEPKQVASTAPRSATDAPAGEISDATSAEDPGAGADNYDFIYGHTVARSVEGAAVRVAEEPADPGGLISSVPGEQAAVEPGLAGDHDGMTISRSDLSAMASAAAVPAGAEHDQVLAVLCSAGHPNAPHATNCRVCGTALGTAAPVSVPRPPLGILVFSNGERVVVDRTVLIGRNPRVSGTLTGELPRIVKLESAGQGLSRTHAEVRVEGWQMLLEDLQSTNGTEVTLPGQAPRRLHAGDPVALVVGSLVDFGEELQCRVEVVS